MTQFLIPPPSNDPSQSPVSEAHEPPPRAPVGRYQYEQAEPGGSRLVPIALLLLLVLGGLGAWLTIRPGSASAWHDDVYEALDVAEVEGRPVFVLFTADWCPPCRQLKADTLAHPEVRSELTERFVMVKVDITDEKSENAGVARSLDVRSIPAMHVYDAEGNRLARRTGYIDPGGAIAWLQDARANR